MANYNVWNWDKARIDLALWDEGPEHRAVFKALSRYIGSQEFPAMYIEHDYFFLGLELAEYDARVDSWNGEEYLIRIATYFLDCIDKHVESDYGVKHHQSRY